MQMQATLSTLRDMDGVVGSFVIDAEGHVLGRDLPGVFDEDTLDYAAERLARLRHALEGDRCALDGGVARFGQHLLVMKAAAGRTLCVIVPAGTNLMALQMGANIVARRVATLQPSAHVPSSEVAITAVTKASGPAPAMTATPSATATGPVARMFRGRRIA